MMRQFLFLLLLCLPLHGKQLDVNIVAEGAILINAKTGAILFEKNAHKPSFPASTTKIGTAIYVLDLWGDKLGSKLTATRECIASISPQAKRQSNYRSPSHWLETDGTHIGIKNGEEFRLFDLLCGMLIGSANDASNVIAQGVGGTIPSFMEGLNRYLREIGCLNTTFNNPHGLHHPDHLTTPYDLAIMARKGLENPIFRQIVSMSRYDCPQTNLEYERTFIQTNQLLRSGPFSYAKAIGVKTGTTQAAGKNLVAAAEEDGRCLIAVLLGCREARSELYRDVTKLFDVAFNEPKMRRYLLKRGETDLTTRIAGAKRPLKTFLPDGLYYDFYPAEESTVKAAVNWDLPPLPIQAGDRVGVVRVTDERGNLVREVELLAHEDLKATLWYRLSHLFSENAGKKVLFLGGVGSVAFFMWMLRKKRPRRPLF
ncbi:MAG: D-alanyl-D-alanine carboxypeptidase [Chlamydiales bacterium]|nr:D-alanyl-D-alanine carboxypeptidase [Chlamydiales bacterium]